MSVKLDFELVLNDGFNHWVLYTLTNWIYLILILLWNFKIFSNVREEII